MLDATTKRKIDSARQILVGKVPDPKAQVEQITTALVYKFMDDMDKEAEELGGKAKFFTDDLKDFAWSKLLDTRYSGQERMDLYVRAISAFAKAKQLPQLFRDIFKDAFLPYRDPETLSLFLKEIDNFTYDHSEDLGNAFEYLLSVLGSQGDAGQFRTPRHIIDFIVAVIDPKKNETVLDPACGTAGFLISAYKHILKNHDGFDNKTGKPTTEERLLTPDERKKMMNNFVGYDISPDMVKLSLVNMYLHGFLEPKIYEYDTLTSEKHWGEQFDVIIANPPFMSPKGGIRPHKRFSVQAKRSEVLFVDYILEHLPLKGRAGIIVPEGIIFKTENAYKQLRQKLCEDGLFAVVSLPSGVFNPYAGVKTSILLFDNQLAKKSDEILFLKIENDGFDLGAQRRKIDKNDLPEALDVLDEWKQDKKKESNLALWVKKEKIVDSGDYNLTGERYRIDQFSLLRESINQIEETMEVYSKALEPMRKMTEEYNKALQNLSAPIEQLQEMITSSNFSRFSQDIQNAVESMQKAFDVQNLQKVAEEVQYLKEHQTTKSPLVALGEVCEIKRGSTITKKQAVKGDIPVIAGGQQPAYYHNEANREAPVVTVSASGAYAGFVNFFDKPIYASDCSTIQPKDKNRVDIQFIYCLLKSRQKEIYQLQQGGGQPHVHPKDLEKIKIPLPPLEVQKEIVEQIEVKQNAINHAKEIIKNLERERRYFGQELRKLENVEWIEMEKVAEIFTDGNWIESKDQSASGIRLIQTGNVGVGEYLDKGDKARYISDDTFKRLKCTEVFEGDVLISRLPDPVGRACLIPKLDTRAITAVDCTIVRFEKEKVDQKYFVLYSMTSDYFDSLEQFLTGSSRRRISRSNLAKVKIPLPSLEIQKQLVAEAEKEEEIIAANRRLIELMERKIENVLTEI